MLIRQGMSLRKVAELIGVSHEMIRRLVKSEGIVLQRSEQKLTDEQLQIAFDLLKADMPIREVAQKFDIHHESLRRLAQRDGVEIRPRGHKLSPTLRVLTVEQRQEAVDAVRSGTSLRQVAKRFGINRYSLRRLMEEG